MYPSLASGLKPSRSAMPAARRGGRTRGMMVTALTPRRLRRARHLLVWFGEQVDTANQDGTVSIPGGSRDLVATLLRAHVSPRVASWTTSSSDRLPLTTTSSAIANVRASPTAPLPRRYPTAPWVRGKPPALVLARVFAANMPETRSADTRAHWRVLGGKRRRHARDWRFARPAQKGRL